MTLYLLYSILRQKESERMKARRAFHGVFVSEKQAREAAEAGCQWIFERDIEIVKVTLGEFVR